VKNSGIPDSHEYGVDVHFLAKLVAIDAEAAEAVRMARCGSCGSRLDRADYPRKPRGGLIASAAEAWSKRQSFCCSREGCRKRATPPSVRFLGRRVYAEVVVVIASVHGQVVEQASALRRATGVAARTIRRWLSWWRSAFLASALWSEACARLVPAPDTRQLPASLLVRFSAATALLDLARFLGPMTTGTVPNGSRTLQVTM
jgi:hypothetical protein